MKLSKLFTTFVIAIVVLFTGCKKDDFVEVDGVCPLVILTSPVNQATSVPFDQIITATFNEKMNAETVTAASFSLLGAKKGLQDVTGTFSYNDADNTISFVPNPQLEPGTTYTGTVKAIVKDLQGNALQADYFWSFSTGLIVNPTVISTDPFDQATGILLNKTVTANFSEAMNGATLTAANFTLKEGVNPVAGAVSYTDTTASFNPTGNLLPGKIYTATITTAAQNLAGTGLAIDKIWTFTTVAPLVPSVISTSPLDLASNVAINKTVTATFSVPMNGASLTNTTFTLIDEVNTITIAGSVSYTGTTASFNPTADLLPGIEYTATVTTGATSAGGTAMASDTVWKFTTLAAGVPFVTSTVPLDQAINVPLDQVVSADFSEAMDQLTFTNSTFTLMDGATVIAGSVNYSGTTASFTPSVLLVLGKTYKATITTGAESSGGTPIAIDYVWTFSTGATLPLGPGIIDLGTAGNFAILSKSGISTTGVTSITGDIGVSPIDQTALTGFSQTMDATNEFSTSIYVTGKLFASDYTEPTPTNLTTAISDMETALTTGMGMTLSVITEIGAGDISGMTLAPGLYKWGTGLNISGVGVTLEGGPDDTWVFQIADDFIVDGDIILSGGAQAKNIFWVSQTQVLLASTVDFSGNIIAQTLIDLKTGAKVTGRLLSQTAVTLDAATVVKP